jgi:allantoin racemase
VIGIWVINPNTTQAMTDKIEECARAVAGSGVIVIGITSQIGPESIESHYDEAPSVPGVLQAVQRGETRRHRRVCGRVLR